MAEEGKTGSLLSAIGTGLTSAIGGLPGALVSTGLNFLTGGLFGGSSEKKSLKMWKAQQEYNSPKNQITRLEAAGLNPARALSNGQIENTIGMPEVPNMPAAFQAGAGALENSLKLSALKSELDLNKAKEKELLANANKTNAEIPWVDKLNQQTFDLMGSQEKEILSRIPVNEQQQKVLEQTYENLTQQYNQIIAQTDLLKANKDYIESEKFYQDIVNKYAEENQKLGLKMTEQQIHTAAAQAKAFISSASLSDSMAKMTDLQYQIENFLRADGTTYKMRRAFAKQAESGAVVAGNDAEISEYVQDLRKQLSRFSLCLSLAMQAFELANKPAGTAINAAKVVGGFIQ